MNSESKSHLYLTSESGDHTQTRQFRFGQILKISQPWQDNLSCNLVLICVCDCLVTRSSISAYRVPITEDYPGNHPLRHIWIIKLTLINATWAQTNIGLLSRCDECRNNEEYLASERWESAACHPGSDEGRPRTNERLLWVLLPSVSSPSIGNNLISIREDSHHLMKHLTELSNISRQQSLSVCLPNRPSMSIMNIILPSMILYNLHYFIHISIWEMRCDQMWFTFEDSVLTTELSRRC